MKDLSHNSLAGSSLFAVQAREFDNTESPATRSKLPHARRRRAGLSAKDLSHKLAGFLLFAVQAGPDCEMLAFNSRNFFGKCMKNNAPELDGSREAPTATDLRCSLLGSFQVGARRLSLGASVCSLSSSNVLATAWFTVAAAPQAGQPGGRHVQHRLQLAQVASDFILTPTHISNPLCFHCSPLG